MANIESGISVVASVLMYLFIYGLFHDAVYIADHAV